MTLIISVKKREEIPKLYALLREHVLLTRLSSTRLSRLTLPSDRLNSTTNLLRSRRTTLVEKLPRGRRKAKARISVKNYALNLKNLTPKSKKS